MPIIDYPLRSVGSLGELRAFLPLKVTSLKTNISYEVEGVVDPGAGTTLIPYYIANELGFDITTGKQVIAPTAGGELLVYFHACKIQVLSIDDDGNVDSSDVIINLPTNYFAFSSKEKFPPVLLLGIKDFLEQYVLTFDYPRRVFSIQKPAES